MSNYTCMNIDYKKDFQNSKKPKDYFFGKSLKLPFFWIIFELPLFCFLEKRFSNCFQTTESDLTLIFFRFNLLSYIICETVFFEKTLINNFCPCYWNTHKIPNEIGTVLAQNAVALILLKREKNVTSDKNLATFSHFTCGTIDLFVSLLFGVNF